MKKQITLSDFRDEFNAIRSGQFSYDALEALYSYLINFEDETGHEIELDVIELCCNYAEVGKDEHFEEYDDTEEAKDLIISELKNGMLLVRQG